MFKRIMMQTFEAVLQIVIFLQLLLALLGRIAALLNFGELQVVHEFLGDIGGLAFRDGPDPLAANLLLAVDGSAQILFEFAGTVAGHMVDFDLDGR